MGQPMNNVNIAEDISSSQNISHPISIVNLAEDISSL